MDKNISSTPDKTSKELLQEATRKTLNFTKETIIKLYKAIDSLDKNIGRRMTNDSDNKILKIAKNNLVKILIAAGVGYWWVQIYNIIKNDIHPENVVIKTPETFFDIKYYLDISGKSINVPYIQKEVLLEEMPTAYDNILYAKSINGVNTVEETNIYTTCQRMTGLENKINEYGTKYNIPANKLIWLIMLESEGLPNLWNKSLKYKYNCYGCTQLSVEAGKFYGAIHNITKKNKKGKKYTITQDDRDNIDFALDATCKFLTEVHWKYVKAWYMDTNRSLTFASYHMGETHMHKILDIAQKKTHRKPSTMQDLIEINDKDLANEFMSLKDESYKYYPKLLAAWRIYDLYKSNRNEFNTNVQKFIDSPIKRKPSLAEEWPWYGDGSYYTDTTDLKKAMLTHEICWIYAHNGDLILDNNIWENTDNANEKEMMHMTSKASRWVLKFLSFYCPFTIKVTSLTRSEEYNSKSVYNTKKKKWTSHATGCAIDIWFPKKLEQKRHLQRVLYGLEVQGKIAFITEWDHLHVVLNPKYKKHFESIVDNTYIFQPNEEKLSPSDEKSISPQNIIKDTVSHQNVVKNKEYIWIQVQERFGPSIVRDGFDYIKISTNKAGERYFVYKYAIKNNWTPWDVALAFKSAFPRFSTHQILVTDKSWTLYKTGTKLNSWELAYLKVNMKAK